MCPIFFFFFKKADARVKPADMDEIVSYVLRGDLIELNGYLVAALSENDVHGTFG